jgi:hypothetical protein
MRNAIINSYRSTVRTAKVLYHTTAFIALCVCIATAVSTEHSGYVQLVLPVGAQLAQVDGTKLSENAANSAKQKQKEEKQADASPLPGTKPHVPVPMSGTRTP